MGTMFFTLFNNHVLQNCILFTFGYEQKYKNDVEKCSVEYSV